MKNHILLLTVLTILVGACTQNNQSPKHYYVGNHKFYQFPYGIHEDTGLPIGGTNKKTSSVTYRPQYKADGSSREL